jgi:hypothetical protein
MSKILLIDDDLELSDKVRDWLVSEQIAGPSQTTTVIKIQKRQKENQLNLSPLTVARNPQEKSHARSLTDNQQVQEQNPNQEAIGARELLNFPKHPQTHRFLALQKVAAPQPKMRALKAIAQPQAPCFNNIPVSISPNLQTLGHIVERLVSTFCYCD